MMAKRFNLISVDDYLAAELVSPIKHEYLGGAVYGRPEERNLHNLVAGNTFAILHARLRGHRHWAFNSDTKIRVRLPAQVRFYYPEASVVCRPNPPTESYQDEPVVIVEVLSKQTRRIDEGEKKDAYLTIPSLCVYLLIEQDMPAIVAYRRTEQGFIREVYEGLAAVVPLSEIEIVLPLAEVYEAVEFAPEAADEEIG